MNNVINFNIPANIWHQLWSSTMYEKNDWKVLIIAVKSA